MGGLPQGTQACAEWSADQALIDDVVRVFTETPGEGNYCVIRVPQLAQNAPAPTAGAPHWPQKEKRPGGWCGT